MLQLNSYANPMAFSKSTLSRKAIAASGSVLSIAEYPVYTGKGVCPCPFQGFIRTKRRFPPP
jgi:hypothetical protein